MSAHDGCIDHGVFVVSLGAERFKHTLPNTRSAPAHMPRMNDAEITKAFRQVSPGDACAIAVKHSIYEEAVVFTGGTDVSCSTGQKVFDVIPVGICQGISTIHAINNAAAIRFDDTP